MVLPCDNTAFLSKQDLVIFCICFQEKWCNGKIICNEYFWWRDDTVIALCIFKKTWPLCDGDAWQLEQLKNASKQNGADWDRHDSQSNHTAGSLVVRVLDLRLATWWLQVWLPPLGWLSLGGQITSVTNQLRPTEPPALSRTGNEYQPKCGDALQLGVKAGKVHSTCG